MSKKLRRVSKISDYKRDKKNLIPPLGSLNMVQTNWVRDLLPEYLWIDSLINRYPQNLAIELYNSFLDIADSFRKIDPDSKDLPLLGHISQFMEISTKDRKPLLAAMNVIYKQVMLPDFINALSLYPNNPMDWLIVDSETSDKDQGVDYLQNAVERLYPGKDEHSGLCRAIPLNRLFKHNKLKISSKMSDLVTGLKTYPQGDRYHVESFARSVINTSWGMEVERKASLTNWSKLFWKLNGELSKCYDQ